jgi:hypothetical protein
MSRGLFRRDLEQAKNLLNEKYSVILELLSERAEEQKLNKKKKGYTVSELKGDLSGNYKHVWRFVNTLVKFQVIKKEGIYLRLADSKEAEHYEERANRLEIEPLTDCVPCP